jgi:hypothetical protein
MVPIAASTPWAATCAAPVGDGAAEIPCAASELVDEEHLATSTPASATAGAKFRQGMRTTVFEPAGITWRFEQPLDC